MPELLFHLHAFFTGLTFQYYLSTQARPIYYVTTNNNRYILGLVVGYDSLYIIDVGYHIRLPSPSCRMYTVTLTRHPSHQDVNSQDESESECKCLTCNQKPTGSQFSLLHEPNKKINGKTKKKAIEQSGVRKGSPMEGKDLRKRYLLSLEWKRQKSRSDGQ